MQTITLVTAGIFFAVLYFRYRSRPKDGPRRTRRQQFKIARILLAAIVAWLTIHYSLAHTIAKMDGVDHEPSLAERLVSFLSK